MTTAMAGIEKPSAMLPLTNVQQHESMRRRRAISAREICPGATLAGKQNQRDRCRASKAERNRGGFHIAYAGRLGAAEKLLTLTPGWRRDLNLLNETLKKTQATFEKCKV